MPINLQQIAERDKWLQEQLKRLEEEALRPKIEFVEHQDRVREFLNQHEAIPNIRK